MSSTTPIPSGAPAGDDAKSLRLLALVAERTRHCVAVLDVDGLLLWANETFTRSFEYGPDEYLGRNPCELLYGPETNLDTVAQIGNSIQNGIPFAGELQNYCKSGR